jgi:hypothetical protein
LAKATWIWAGTGAALATALATGVRAENWYNFYMVPQGVAFVDMDSIIRRPGHITARVQSTFPEPQRLAKDGQVITYTKSVDMIDVDCRARVYRYLNRDLMNDAGQQLTSVNDADNPILIRDHTAEDVLAKAFCPKS